MMGIMESKTRTASIISQSQAQPKRVSIMKELAKRAFSHKVRALEIGVWYGLGSTNIWLDTFMDDSEIIC